MSYHSPESLYHIFSQIIRLHHHRAHSELERVGVYPGQPPLLLALHIEDGQSQKDLAAKLRIKPATVTVMVKRMEKAGLLERRPDSVDQRISRVYLTEVARQVWTRVSEAMGIVEEVCFRGFTEEERVLLRRLLVQMRENLSGVQPWADEDES